MFTLSNTPLSFFCRLYYSWTLTTGTRTTDKHMWLVIQWSLTMPIRPGFYVFRHGEIQLEPG